MVAGDPQQPDDNDRQPRRATVAVWCQAVGALLAIATVTCAWLNVISTQQTVALGLLAVLLIAGGVTATSTMDQPTAERLGFRAGLHVGVLLRRLRSIFRRR
jgi:hypothetical protein